MLPKPQRIRQAYEFSRVFKRGRRLQSAHLRLAVLATAGNRTRFGFVVSKRAAKTGGASGKSAHRNRLKRVLRACASRAAGELPAGLMIVVSARDGVVSLPARAVREEMQELIEKLKP